MRKAGIDAGGTLMKLAVEEEGRLHFKMYPVSQMKEAAQWLSLVSQGAEIALTGGKAGVLKQEHFPGAVIVPEFDAVCDGVEYMLKRQGSGPSGKYILVNIGTGTSWYLIDGDKKGRVLGSGIGGGTLMGLGALLGGAESFKELVESAAAGNKENVDLLVRDIYHPQEPPIPGWLTASNFAKAAEQPEQRPEDRLAAAVNMIMETLGTITIQAAAQHGVKEVVFTGSTLIGNEPLKQGLEKFLRMFELSPFFVAEGEYSGACGALLAL